MKVGDIVTRKSYDNDVDFIIKEVENHHAILIGLKYRLVADAELSDLLHVKDDINNEHCAVNNKHLLDTNLYKSSNLICEEACDLENYRSSLCKCKKRGSVLHIDGDLFYLKQCLLLYEKLGINASGYCIEESMQPAKIEKLLKEHKCNILVITGHDSLPKGKDNSFDLDDYCNSKYYVESVSNARKTNENYDNLIIIAGGCQSYYEEIMKAGANFACSPNRVLIEINEPVYVAAKIAMTSIRDIVDIDMIIDDTIVSSGDIGGVETRGLCRIAKPTF